MLPCATLVASQSSALTQYLAGLRVHLDDPELTELCINRPQEAFIEVLKAQ